MPTRRVMELIVITTLLIHPVMGVARLWAAKTLGTAQPGTASHTTAEIVAVLA